METILAVVDALLMGGAFLGLLLSRRLGGAAGQDIGSAFALLDRSIQMRYPGLPPGYTWSEAFDWLRRKGVQADWNKLRGCLSSYEAYRYGEKPLEGEDCHRDIAVLAMKLGGSRGGDRTKA